MMLAALAALLAVSPPVETLLPGTYANEEQVNAAPGVPWTGARITAAGTGFSFQRIDAFDAGIGKPEAWQVTQTSETVTIHSGRCRRDFARVLAGLTLINQSRACAGSTGPTSFIDRGLALTAADGTVLDLQRARAFTCAATVGGWSNDALLLHDAGGRVVIGDAATSRMVLRLRHNAFPIGTDEARLILEIDGDRAARPLAAAFADPAATRIGIDLPLVTARCALAG